MGNYSTSIVSDKLTTTTPVTEIVAAVEAKAPGVYGPVGFKQIIHQEAGHRVVLHFSQRSALTLQHIAPGPVVDTLVLARRFGPGDWRGVASPETVQAWMDEVKRLIHPVMSAAETMKRQAEWQAAWDGDASQEDYGLQGWW